MKATRGQLKALRKAAQKILGKDNVLEVRQPWYRLYGPCPSQIEIVVRPDA